MKNAKLKRKQKRVAAPAAPALQTALKIDLGCGPNKKPGFLGVDQTAFPGVDVVTDLRKPWPWADGSVDEAHSSHFVEHLTALERIAFFNELFRVLKPGVRGSDGKPVVGFATIVTPHWSSCRAYGDPTHQWPPVCEFAWFYLSKIWRAANAPHTDAAHLPGGFDCNFDSFWGFTLEPGVSQRNTEYQQHAMTYYKEACQDMITTLIKL